MGAELQKRRKNGGGVNKNIISQEIKHVTNDYTHTPCSPNKNLNM